MPNKSDVLLETRGSTHAKIQLRCVQRLVGSTVYICGPNTGHGNRAHATTNKQSNGGIKQTKPKYSQFASQTFFILKGSNNFSCICTQKCVVETAFIRHIITYRRRRRNITVVIVAAGPNKNKGKIYDVKISKTSGNAKSKALIKYFDNTYLRGSQACLLQYFVVFPLPGPFNLAYRHFFCLRSKKLRRTHLFLETIVVKLSNFQHKHNS